MLPVSRFELDIPCHGTVISVINQAEYYEVSNRSGGYSQNVTHKVFICLELIRHILPY